MRRPDHHDPAVGPETADSPASAAGQDFLDAATAEEGAFPAPPSTLTIDWRLYEHHLAEADLTDQEKREFIEALWYIIVSFVDLGFGIEPVQQALKAAVMADLKPGDPVLETAKESRLAKRGNAADDARDYKNKENNQKGRKA